MPDFVGAVGELLCFGVGVADHWLGHAQDREHWRDTQIRMRGPIVLYLEGTAEYDAVDRHA